jgi:hypothetical protein
MTPEQKTTLLSLIRKYGDAEVKWQKDYHEYMSAKEIPIHAPSSKPAADAYKEIVDFVHKL